MALLTDREALLAAWRALADTTSQSGWRFIPIATHACCQLRAGRHFPGNEEALLALERNPLQYNDTVIWPDKIRLNNWYEEHRSFGMDLLILCYTFLPFLHFNAEDFMEERGISEGKVF